VCIADATAMALRAARAHTGKPKLGIFDGAYHGTHDWGMVAADPASPDPSHPRPVFTSDGVPDCVLGGVAILPYNSDATFERSKPTPHRVVINRLSLLSFRFFRLLAHAPAIVCSP
jgi:glutamate-1-semialdehyde aminotransferase